VVIVVLGDHLHPISHDQLASSSLVDIVDLHDTAVTDAHATIRARQVAVVISRNGQLTVRQKRRQHRLASSASDLHTIHIHGDDITREWLNVILSPHRA
jgi:hypothetical protein